jgi:FlaA1/EpsC-like NDP-sugar epimerase
MKTLNTLKGTIIYGAGNAGKQLFDILSKENSKAVFCFVDDNKKLNGNLCRNKKILSFNQLVKLSQQYHIPNIIIAIPSIKREILIKLIDKLNPLALNINFLSLKKINNDKKYLSDIINGNLINFLGRKISVIDKKLLNNLNDKVILITGAGGSIGSELCKQLSKLKIKKIIALENSELNFYKIKKNDYINNKIKLVLGNILDQKLIKFLDQKYKIDIVFHAAAYKHVNILEDNIYQAVENNIFGTLNLLEAFKEKKKEFILISTDKAAKPRNNLGFTKRISEIIAQDYSSKLKINIVRFGNVFGSQGSAIDLFIDQINCGGPVTITNKNVKRYFMSINEACNLVIQSSQLKENSKIFILKMGNQIKLIDIIKKLISYKKIRDPSSKINIKEIGLKKGEKMEEILSLSNKFIRTSHPDIVIADEPRYSSIEIKKFLSELSVCYSKIDEKKIKLCLTKFLHKEI